MFTRQISKKAKVLYGQDPPKENQLPLLVGSIINYVSDNTELGQFTCADNTHVLIDRFLGDAFGVSSSQFWSIVLQSGARLPIHTLNYWTEQSVVPGF